VFTIGRVRFRVGIGTRLNYDAGPDYADFRLSGRGRLLLHWQVYAVAFWVMQGLALGVAVWIAGLAANSPAPDLLLGITIGVAGGVILGIFVGLIGWASTPMTNTQPQTPVGALRNDLKLAYLHSLAIELATSAMGLTLVMAGQMNGVTASLIIGLGMTYGLLVVLARRSGLYAITVATLWIQRIPLRLLRPLEDAHRLGLLKKSARSTNSATQSYKIT
jgi:hypothetical protein